MFSSPSVNKEMDPPEEETVVEYHNVFQPRWLYKNYTRIDQQTLKLCIDKNQHLPPLKIVGLKHNQNFFATPVIFECHHVKENNEFSSFYLNAFGRRKSIFLRFKSLDVAMTHSTETALVEVVNDLRKLPGICKSLVDAKLAHLRPFRHACCGPEYGVKLYFNDGCGPSAYKLRAILGGRNNNSKKVSSKLCETFHADLGYISISTENRFLTDRMALPYGELSFNRAGKMYDGQCGLYKERNVYYNNIDFINCDNIVLSPASSKQAHVNIMIETDRVLRIDDDRSQLAQFTTDLILKVARGAIVTTSLPEPIVWKWKTLKETYQYPLFKRLVSLPDAAFEQLLHDHNAGWPTDNGIPLSLDANMIARIRLCLCAKHFRVKALHKLMWETHVLQHELKECNRKRDRDHKLQEISARQHYIAFDIETNFEPHRPGNKDSCDEVICISAVLFNSTDGIKDHRVFMRNPKPNDNDSPCLFLNRARIIEKCSRIVHVGDFTDAVRGTTLNMNAFEVVLYPSELDTLEGFLAYVRDNNTAVVTGFNMFKFDLMVIENRYNYLLTKERRKITENRQTQEYGFEKKFKLSFTHRTDNGGSIRHNIKYDEQVALLKKRAKRKRSVSTDGRKRRRVQPPIDMFFAVAPGRPKPPLYERCRGSTIAGDSSDEDNNNECQDDLDKKDELWKHNSYRVNAESVMSLYKYTSTISMDHVGLLDAMRVLSDDKNRGCKLDTLASKQLGLHKLDDPRVSYANMFKTWTCGNTDDLETLTAYSWVDSLLVALLVITSKTESFHAALSIETNLSPRELYVDAMIPIVCSLFYKCGARRGGIALPDTGIIRDDAYMSKPGFVFDPTSQFDFENLKFPAGRTVNNRGVFNLPSSTVDYSSQYPTIICRLCLCPTSLLTQEAIDQQNLTEGFHYTKIHIENVCEKVNRRLGRDYFFCKSTFYNALGPEVCKDLLAKRNEIKLLMKHTNVSREKDRYNAQQLAIKKVNNSIYGTYARLCQPVGAAITKVARDDMLYAAETWLSEMSHGLFNGDTDSIFPLLGTMEDCGNLSRLVSHLGLPRKSSLVVIQDKMMDIHTNYLAKVNEQIHPSRLELEKLFWGVVMFGKKNYVGFKTVPTGDDEQPYTMLFHGAGVSGIKKTSTFVTRRVQFIMIKLLFRGDISGMFAFARDLYDFVSNETFIEEVLEHRERVLCDNVDRCNSRVEGASHMLDVDNNERLSAAESELTAFVYGGGKEEERKRLKGGLLPMKYLVSEEKVGDMAKMITVSCKKAWHYCRCNGLDAAHAPMFVDVVRGSSVQIGTPIQSLMRVLLVDCDAGKEEDRKRMKKLANKKHDRLDITAMPERLLGKRPYRYQLSKQHELMAMALMDHISQEENKMAMLRTNNFNRNCNAVVEPADFIANGQHKLKLRRVMYFLEAYKESDTRPPLYVTDKDYTVSSLCELPESTTRETWEPLGSVKRQLNVCRLTVTDRRNLKNMQGRTVDLWQMYVDLIHSSKDHSWRYYIISGDTLHCLHHKDKTVVSKLLDTPPIDTKVVKLRPDDSSWSVEIEIGAKTLLVILDMWAYRQQTRSTPYISEQYSGKCSISNRDSYLLNAANAFACTLKTESLRDILNTKGIPTKNNTDAIVYFQAVCNRNVIIVWVLQVKGLPTTTLRYFTVRACPKYSKPVELPITSIDRDDLRNVSHGLGDAGSSEPTSSRWLWGRKSGSVMLRDLQKAFSKRRPLRYLTSLSFNHSNCTVSVHHESEAHACVIDMVTTGNRFVQHIPNACTLRKINTAQQNTVGLSRNRFTRQTKLVYAVPPVGRRVEVSTCSD